MPSDKDIALIQDYLAGKLAGKDLTDFEQRLEAEPDLAEELKVEKGMDKVLLAGRRDDLNARMQAIRSRKKQQKLPNWAWAAAAGILLLVLVGMWQLFPPLGPEDLFDRHFELYTTGGPFRTTDPVTPYEKAWTNYLDGEYEPAQTFFDSVREGDSLFFRARMYAAVCAIGLEDFDDADQRFGIIEDEKGSPLHYDAKWYRGLIALKWRKWELAIGHFKVLQDEADWYKPEAIQEILRTLGD